MRRAWLQLLESQPKAQASTLPSTHTHQDPLQYPDQALPEYSQPLAQAQQDIHGLHFRQVQYTEQAQGGVNSEEIIDEQQSQQDQQQQQAEEQQQQQQQIQQHLQQQQHEQQQLQQQQDQQQQHVQQQHEQQQQQEQEQQVYAEHGRHQTAEFVSIMCLIGKH